MGSSVVITGIGMVTPLGNRVSAVLDGILQGKTAAAKPLFDVSNFDCQVCAAVAGFDAEKFFPGNKSLRLMNRDAQMAIVAAKLAMEDSGIKSDREYSAARIALYGSTGMATMAVEEITQIVKHSVREDGHLSLGAFGAVALRRVRPVLSFRILANMPICFVSISENIKGPNAVYTPWQGHGAHAIIAGIKAIERQEADCALVGGCDVRTRELSFVSLQQLGIFESWKQFGKGVVPGEGAVFIVLESEKSATSRKKTPYARITDFKTRSIKIRTDMANVVSELVSSITINSHVERTIVASDGDNDLCQYESHALKNAGLDITKIIKPKMYTGDLFAASAALQVSIAAKVSSIGKAGDSYLSNCFGYGTEQASFLLEAL